MIGGGRPATPFPQFTPYPDGGPRLLVAFSADPNQAPSLNERAQEVSLGRDWMRMHLPQQWASYCALRLRGEEIEVSAEEADLAARTVLEELGFGASNEAIATALVKKMHEFIALRVEPDTVGAIYLGTWRPRETAPS